MARDPLTDLQPHTPKRLPDGRPTCSEKTESNMGCDMYMACPFTREKTAQKGPFQVIVEHHRDVKQGEGRRVPVWCFNYCRQFLDRSTDEFGQKGENYGNIKPGYTLCDDRVYAELETKEVTAAEYTPDGKLAKPAQYKNTYTAARLKPYDQQGPYPWPAETRAPDGALEAIRKGQADAVGAK